MNYRPISFVLSVFLLICFVVPFVLYFLFKKNQKEQYINKVNELNIKLQENKEEQKRVINDSRATFFASKK